MSEFIHLHCHSEYSMLDSAIRLPALCERAVSFGMEACAITDHGNLCRAEIPSGKHFFPAYPVPPGTTTEQEFRRIAEEGLRKRLSEKPSGPPSDETPYWKQLRHEMDVITRMGFPAYFLVVHEFVTWARDDGIPVGPGRGSGAAPSRLGPCASRISTRLNTASFSNAS